MNGDGKGDLIVVNSWSELSNNVSVLLGNGDGTFGSKVDYATGAYPYKGSHSESVTSRDVNGDGKVDLIVANRDNDTVSVLLNDGDGTFGKKVDYATGFHPDFVTSGDVNGDGKADLIVTNRDSGTVSVLLNNSVSYSASYSKGTAVVISDSIQISDPDGNAGWNGGTLRVQITGHAEAADNLSMATADPVGNGIWLDTAGNRVMAGSLEIGTADASSAYGGDAWTFIFNANATSELVQDVARSLIFNNSDSTPGLGDRGISFTVTDSALASASLVENVTVVNSPPTGSVLIVGLAKQGQTLMVATSTIADADGLGVFSYQWYNDGVVIEGATTGHYTLTQAEVGHRVSVSVSYKDGGGTHESLSSGTTVAVANVNDSPQGTIVIAGAAILGQTLTAITNSIADADGLGVFSYKWYSDGLAIPYATAEHYMLTQAEVGHSLTVDVSYIDGGGKHESLTSMATSPVIATDIEAPWVTGFSPTEGANSVNVMSDIIMTFSEGVQRGTGLIEIHSGSATGSVFESYDVSTDTQHLTFSGDTLSINPASNLLNGTNYFVTLGQGTVKDMAGNDYAGTTAYDFTTAAEAYDLHGSAHFWKTGAPIAGVTGALTTQPSTSQPLELRLAHVDSDGSCTIEIWTNSTRTDLDSLQVELSLPIGSVASWQNATTLPSGWSSIANTEEAGKFIFGAFGLTPLSSGPVKLGALTLGAVPDPSHVEVQMTSGMLGNDLLPSFGIIYEKASTGAAGAAQYTGLDAGSYDLQVSKAIDTSVVNAVRANDALAALKIAVGLNPNGDGGEVVSYQYLAADVNKDGHVNAADALNILKMAVHLSTAPTGEWLFVSDSVGSDVMSRTSVHWPADTLPVMIDHNLDLQLIGIVKGDVNGSWVA